MDSDMIKELERETAVPNIIGCKLCYYIANVSDEKAAAFKRALASNAQHIKVADIFNQYGYKTSETAVRRHRRNHA